MRDAADPRVRRWKGDHSVYRPAAIPSLAVTILWGQTASASPHAWPQTPMVPTGALQYFSFYNFWVSPNDIKPSSGYGWNWTEISSWMNLPTVDPIALESDCWLAQWKQGTHSYIMCASC